MRSHRSLIVISGVLLVAAATILYALPTVARHVAISRLQTITKRPVSIDRVDVQLLSGRFTIHGLRVAEPDGGAPFADCERLEARLHLLSLLRGHIWVRELAPPTANPSCRTTREGLQLLRSDRRRGRNREEVRCHPRPVHAGRRHGRIRGPRAARTRTWTSDDIQIEAHNVSTLRDDGTVVASSVTAGAPNLVEIEQFRLYPIHLQATVTVKGLDLALARLYLPADAPIVLDQGRVSSTLKVTLDARAGVRADLTGEFEDLALVRPGEREPVTQIPKLTARLTDFTVRDEQVRVGEFEVKGSASVRDRSGQQHARYQVSAIRASIADLTWPITTPGRLDVLTAIPGGGTLAVSGMLRPPPAPSQLHLRLSDLDLAAWNRFLPVTARLNGRGEADLRINEPLAAGVPTRVSGAIAVNRLGIRDAHQELASAQRVEATGLEVQWPTRLGVKRLVVSGPRAIVERDEAGGFPLRRLWNRTAAAPAPVNDAKPLTPPSPRIDIGEIAVRNGVLSWRDETVKPRAVFDLSQLDATITGGGWPLRPLGVRLAVRPPGGGQVQVAGRVAVDPFSADLRVNAREAELAHYQAYVPTKAQFSGRADLDLAVVLPALSEPQATVRGNAVLSRVDVRDGQRTVIRIDRAAATALDIDWPRSVKVRELALRRPWILLERDESGALPLPALLALQTAVCGTDAGRESDIECVHGQRQRQRPDGDSCHARPARHRGRRRAPSRWWSDAALRSRPRRSCLADRRCLDGSGSEARPGGSEGAGRRWSAQLARHRRSHQRAAASRSRGRASRIRRAADEPVSAESGGVGGARWLVDHSPELPDRRGDLDAKTEILLSRLQVARASGHDEAQARIGLPLGMIVSLMKDRRGDIRLALPVGGRLTDPRFDFTEVIWSTVRHAAFKVITAPVSWIGRVQFDADSRIQRIEVDPIQFEPGTAAPTPDGQEQADTTGGIPRSVARNAADGHRGCFSARPRRNEAGRRRLGHRARRAERANLSGCGGGAGVPGALSATAPARNARGREDRSPGRRNAACGSRLQAG